MAELWIFVGALVVVYLVPGPDMVLVLQTGALYGRTHALATASGLAIARAVHVTLAALGLAALFKASPSAFQIVRLAGAAYLIWLGIGILRASSLTLERAEILEDGKLRSYFVSVRRGLLTNLLNPKALLFCSVLLPQFIRSEHGSVLGQFLTLGLILVCIGIFFDIIYVYVGGMFGQCVRHHPFIQDLQRWGFASLLIGFGIRLALVE